MEKEIIDRFEDYLAVIEFGEETHDAPIMQLSKNCGVGDLFIFEGDSVTIDKSGTNNLRIEI